MITRAGTIGRTAAVSLTAALALTAAGCGDQGQSGPGYADKDNTVTTSSPDGLSKSELLPATVKAAAAAGSAHLTLTMKGAAQVTAAGDIKYAGRDTAMRMTMSMPQFGSRKMELRYVEKMLYMQMPGMTQHGKFVAIDPTDPSSPLAKNFAGLTDQMDPMGSLKGLEGAVTSSELVGKGDVGGTPVDHYRVTVDTKTMLDRAGKAGQAVPQAGMPAEVTYDMWLDAKNLIRRMTTEVAGTSIETELSRWGKPVEVAKPAPGDIMRAPGA